MSSVGRLHLVPYCVPIVGPRRPDGASGYGGGPAPVCCPCLGDGACGRLDGGGGLCQVECLEASGGVQDPGEVVLRLWWDGERALVVGDAYLGSWVRCDCNLGGRVVSSGSAAWITPRWGVVVTTRMGGSCGPSVGGAADQLIMATDFVGWTMTLLRER